MHPIHNLDILPLILHRYDTMSDQEVYHNDRAVRFKIPIPQRNLDLLYRQQLEIPRRSISRFRDGVFVENHVVHVQHVWNDVVFLVEAVGTE